MMPNRIELSGLAQAKVNLKKLNSIAQNEIGRTAMRELGWIITKQLRASTYQNFQRQTGAIRSGASVAVESEPKGNKLRAWAVEYPQSVAGQETPFKALVRKRLARKRRGKIDTAQVAFWWRFLEFGTKPRNKLRSVRVSLKSKRYAGQLAGEKRRLASPSRGSVVARNFFRPAFASSAPGALKAFRDLFLKLTDAAVSAMPK